VPVEETVRGFREILDGEHDDIPEGAFYMKGGIDQVLEEVRGSKNGGGSAKAEDTEDGEDTEGDDDSADSGSDAGDGTAADDDDGADAGDVADAAASTPGEEGEGEAASEAGQ
jgi:hypothetical protein